MLGGHKTAAFEEVTINFAFASVVTIRSVKVGEMFTRENIWVKRPSINGILAKHYDEILGRCATCDIASDTQLTWNMIGN